jgi:hypothetical protein
VRRANPARKTNADHELVGRLKLPPAALIPADLGHLADRCHGISSTLHRSARPQNAELKALLETGLKLFQSHQAHAERLDGEIH